jgi:hypothetical protein
MLFPVPHGNSGKAFVSELARLYRAFAEGSALESVALMAASVCWVLLLQRSHSKMKSRDYAPCLSRRLDLWHKGDIEELLAEGRSIQQQWFSHEQKSQPRPKQVRQFTNLLFLGKTKAAIDLLSRHERGSVLSLSDVIEDKTVHEILISKHPPAQPPHPEAIIFPDIEPPTVHPIIYESIDAERIRWAALHTFGAAGPSGSDASCWKRLCTALKWASDDFCLALSQFSKRLCFLFLPCLFISWVSLSSHSTQ